MKTSSLHFARFLVGRHKGVHYEDSRREGAATFSAGRLSLQAILKCTCAPSLISQLTFVLGENCSSKKSRDVILKFLTFWTWWSGFRTCWTVMRNFQMMRKHFIVFDRVNPYFDVINPPRQLFDNTSYFLIWSLEPKLFDPDSLWLKMMCFELLSLNYQQVFWGRWGKALEKKRHIHESAICLNVHAHYEETS